MPMTERRLRIHAWLRRTELDRRLAEGTNPTTDPLRAMRARQLGSRRYRRALSAGLRRLVAEAYATDPAWRVAVPPVNRDAVRDAREPLLSLARRLVECEFPCPRAVALASYLVCDPQSPAYWEPTGATLADLASTALGTIDHQPLR
jgi:hypothetical protein